MSFGDSSGTTSGASMESALSLPLTFLAGALVPTLAWFFMGAKSMTSLSPSEGDDSEDEDLAGATAGGPSSRWGYSDAPYKELSMGKGKVAAQCCHAAVACYKRAAKQCPNGLKAWERTGCAKITVKCPTQAEMEDIAVRAIELDIPAYLVEDAGRTQIAAGSRTVLGLGPAPAAVFDGVTSHLKLM